MDMRFGTRNVRSLYRAGALGLVTSEIDTYGIWYRKSGGKVVVLYNQGIILYFMGKVMLTINWEPGFLFIGELGQQPKAGIYQ